MKCWPQFCTCLIPHFMQSLFFVWSKEKSKLKAKIIGACWCNLGEKRIRVGSALHHHHKYSVGGKKKAKKIFTINSSRVLYTTGGCISSFTVRCIPVIIYTHTRTFLFSRMNRNFGERLHNWLLPRSNFPKTLEKIISVFPFFFFYN